VAENASTLALGTLGTAVLLVVLTPVWRLVGLPFVVVVEQVGHSITTLLTGRWISGIDLRLSSKRNTYGFTYPSRRDFKPSLVAFYLSGYSAPPIAGLVLARGVERGWNPAVVIATLFVLVAVLLVFHSNLFTLAVVVAVAAILIALYWQASPRGQWAAVVFVAWILLIGGIRRSFHLVGDYNDDDETDANALQRETGIPAYVWAAVFLLIALASLVVGARWLLTSA
jgi:hypothetical protein